MAELALDRTWPPSAAAWTRRKPQRTTKPRRSARAAPSDAAAPDDLHFRRASGTRGCKAELLADSWCGTSCETLFLVGDIVGRLAG